MEFCSFSAVQCRVCFGLIHLTVCAVCSCFRDWSDNMPGCSPALRLVHNNCGDHVVCEFCVSPLYQNRIDSLSVTFYVFHLNIIFRVAVPVLVSLSKAWCYCLFILALSWLKEWYSSCSSSISYLGDFAGSGGALACKPCQTQISSVTMLQGYRGKLSRRVWVSSSSVCACDFRGAHNRQACMMVGVDQSLDAEWCWIMPGWGLLKG